MEITRAQYLANGLISNSLTPQELDDFLKGLNDEDALEVYSEILGSYFSDLLGGENGKNHQ